MKLSSTDKLKTSMIGEVRLNSKEIIKMELLQVVLVIEEQRAQLEWIGKHLEKLRILLVSSMEIKNYPLDR